MVNSIHLGFWTGESLGIGVALVSGEYCGKDGASHFLGGGLSGHHRHFTLHPISCRAVDPLLVVLVGHVQPRTLHIHRTTLI